MEFSKKLAMLAKKQKLDVREIAFCDLMATGWSSADAYVIAMGKGLSWTDERVLAEADALLGREVIRDRIAVVRSEMQKAAVAPRKKKEDDEADLLGKANKEYILKELVRVKATLTEGTKEWNDINKQIVDIAQLKKDEITVEDKTVHYFLPLKCNMCSLRKKADEESD